MTQAPLVLVTGSSGHLGCALVLSLPSYGFTPLGVDILPAATTSVLCDINDADAVAELFASHRFHHVIHAATLHKPHVGSHTKADFVRTNVSGTLNLLEAAAAAVATTSPVESFIFISTTSAFGSALSPRRGSPAAWIDETVAPVPKNIYGVTKNAAEDLCALAHRETRLPVLVLRTSRFFPEPDDDGDRRPAMADDNLKLCELAYRRVDIADVVSACVCAMRRAPGIGFGRFIISAPSPLSRDSDTLSGLDADAGSVVSQAVPASAAVFADKGWKFLDRIDRVYDSTKAVREHEREPQ